MALYRSPLKLYRCGLHRFEEGFHQPIKRTKHYGLIPDANKRLIVRKGCRPRVAEQCDVNIQSINQIGKAVVYGSPSGIVLVWGVEDCKVGYQIGVIPLSLHRHSKLRVPPPISRVSNCGEGCGSSVIKVSDQGRHVMSSSPVPLKSHRVEKGAISNLAINFYPHMARGRYFKPKGNGLSLKMIGKKSAKEFFSH
ncbi:hypothetical protein TNCV_2500311 [Trichonephila clavipes]|nr:hypothetical protein TNCV_2500311 [Trichonephila clavipes]